MYGGHTIAYSYHSLALHWSSPTTGAVKPFSLVVAISQLLQIKKNMNPCQSRRFYNGTVQVYIYELNMLGLQLVSSKVKITYHNKYVPIEKHKRRVPPWLLNEKSEPYYRPDATRRPIKLSGGLGLLCGYSVKPGSHATH